MMNRRPPRRAGWAWALVPASFLLFLDRPAGSGPGREADPEGFRKVVAPFLEQHCVRCHGPETQKGNLALHTLDGDVAGGKDIARWKAVAERLTLNEMPPEGEPRPDASSLIRVRDWIKKELAKGGESLAETEGRLLLPGYGNRVNHQDLFSGAFTEPAASPARLWRCSPQIYSAMVPRITGRRASEPRGGGPQIAQPFTTSSAEGFKDFSALFVIDEPTIVQLMRNAELAVELQASQGPLSKVVKPLTARATEAEMRAAISRQFQLVLFREPTETELSRFAQLMTRNIKEAGPAIGVRTTLATVLLLPEALYRFERGQGKPDEHGRRFLAPRELAYALAFALTDERPDSMLLQVAEQGKLTTRDDARREVQRLLNDRAIGKPRIMRFFEEYFEFTAALDVFKDFDPERLKKAWQPLVLVNDTRQLIQHILDRDQEVLRELLRTNKSFVNYQVGPNGQPVPAWRHPKNTPGKKDQDPEIPHWYGLPADWKWTAVQPIEFPAGQHAGILTQPSWLAAFATNNENHAIKRGKWIRERLLGGAVPDVPISVDAKIPDHPDKTLRQRMEVTRQAYCWKCHQQMDPLGLPFESYDYLGRFRTRELNRPVDTTGSIDKSGEARLDGNVADPLALVRKLADSPRVRQVFVRHAFRYWMGRNEILADAPTLLAADRAYVDSGGSMKALITALLTSDAFLYRWEKSP